MNIAMPQGITAFQHPGSPVDSDHGGVVSYDVFTSYRVRVPELSSCWAMKIKDRLDELTALPVGWDGYAGRPVSSQTAHFAVNMLEQLCQESVPAPSLVPGSDGSLQAEWHRNSFDVELEVLGPQNVIATRYNLQTGDEDVVEIQSDFSKIVDWISALSNDEKMTEQGAV